MLCYLLQYSKRNQLDVCLWICIHTYIFIHPFYFGFPFHLVHHRTLSRAPCAIQQVLISYIYFYTQYDWCISVNPNLPLLPIFSFPPLLSIFYSACLLHFSFVSKVICISFLDSTCMRSYTILVFLFLTYLTLSDSFQVHPGLCKWRLVYF